MENWIVECLILIPLVIVFGLMFYYGFDYKKHKDV